MGRIVVRIGRVVIGLDHRQPVLQSGLVAVERPRHFKTSHDRHAEPNKRPGKIKEDIPLDIADSISPSLFYC